MILRLVLTLGISCISSLEEEVAISRDEVEELRHHLNDLEYHQAALEAVNVVRSAA